MGPSRCVWPEPGAHPFGFWEMSGVSAALATQWPAHGLDLLIIG